MSPQLIHHTDHPGVEPAVVLIHGFTCDSSDWANQVKWCRDRSLRVVAVDLRGHGRSTQFESGFDMETMGRDVVALLRNIGARSAVLVGHSMGCRVVAEAASRAPDIVAGVVLVDGSRKARGDPNESVERYRGNIERVGFDGWVRELFESMFTPDSDEASKRARTIPSDIGMEAIISVLRWDAMEFDRRFGSIAVPIQVIQSTHKKVPVTAGMSIDWHRELEECGADAEFDLVPCGHFTQLDRPEAVNKNIERMLERVEKIPGGSRRASQ